MPDYLYLKKNKMYRLAITCLLLISNLAAHTQVKFPPLDKSPLDMSYCPNNYPVQKLQDKITEPLVARIIYSRPQKNGRVIFGDLLEYGKVWRLGANESTEIEFFQNVNVDNHKVKKGRYTLYCIPYADKWTLIINKETETWGSFKYDEKKDLLRVDLPVQKQTEIIDPFTMVFDKTIGGSNLLMAWDDVRVSLSIAY